MAFTCCCACGLGFEFANGTIKKSSSFALHLIARAGSAPQPPTAHALQLQVGPSITEQRVMAALLNCGMTFIFKSLHVRCYCAAVAWAQRNCAQYSSGMWLFIR